MAEWAGETVTVDARGVQRISTFYRPTARAAWTAVREQLERDFLDGRTVHNARIGIVSGEGQ